eukprot:gene900-1742_t
MINILNYRGKGISEQGKLVREIYSKKTCPVSVEDLDAPSIMICCLPLFMRLRIDCAEYGDCQSTILYTAIKSFPFQISSVSCLSVSGPILMDFIIDWMSNASGYLPIRYTLWAVWNDTPTYVWASNLERENHGDEESIKDFEEITKTDLSAILNDLGGSCSNLVDILDDLSTYEMLESNTLNNIKTNIDLKDFLEARFEEYYIRAIEKDIHFSVDTSVISSEDYDKLYIIGDRSKLSHVIRCVVNAAFDATRRRGKVKVRIHVEKITEILKKKRNRHSWVNVGPIKPSTSILECDESHSLVISVTDSGRLLSKRHQTDFLADGMGFTAGTLDTKTYDSLGLWIASRVLKLHQGTISLSSSPNNTTTEPSITLDHNHHQTHSSSPGHGSAHGHNLGNTFTIKIPVYFHAISKLERFNENVRRRSSNRTSIKSCCTQTLGPLLGSSHDPNDLIATQLQRGQSQQQLQQQRDIESRFSLVRRFSSFKLLNKEKRSSISALFCSSISNHENDTNTKNTFIIDHSNCNIDTKICSNKVAPDCSRHGSIAITTINDGKHDNETDFNDSYRFTKDKGFSRQNTNRSLNNSENAHANENEENINEIDNIHIHLFQMNLGRIGINITCTTE